MSEIKAIETIYNGYRFRSRLEARWAVFFDALGVKYEYEPEGFELPSGKRYLPDFKIKCYGTRGAFDDPGWEISPCETCKHRVSEDKYCGDFASWWDEFCEFFVDPYSEPVDWITLRRPPERTEIVGCEKYESRSVPFDLYVEVKGEMTKADAEKIKEFAGNVITEELDNGGTCSYLEINNPILIVGNIPNPDEYYADSSDLHCYDQMDGIDIYPWNYELIDGDYFAAYPAVDEGHFYLDGDDSNYQTMNIEVIREAFRKARQARFEHGETPTGGYRS